MLSLNNYNPDKMYNSGWAKNYISFEMIERGAYVLECYFQNLESLGQHFSDDAHPQ